MCRHKSSRTSSNKILGILPLRVRFCAQHLGSFRCSTPLSHNNVFWRAESPQLSFPLLDAWVCLCAHAHPNLLGGSGQRPPELNDMGFLRITLYTWGRSPSHRGTLRRALVWIPLGATGRSGKMISWRPLTTSNDC